MSVSFKTVAKVEAPTAGNLRLGQEVSENGAITSHYKFVGERALTLDEVVTLLTNLDLPRTVADSMNVVSKRSGYKFKTTWTV